MQRMRSVIVKLGPVMVFLIVTGVWWPARGDLIRPKTSRTYPDIAGDIVGSQTYTFDPASQTGTFLVTNSPQLIALGPAGSNMSSVTPDQDGTLSETLQSTLNQNGQIVANPDNRFQLYGTVVIGNQVYRGLLLEGTPTAFGVQSETRKSLSGGYVFDLNVKITGGQLGEIHPGRKPTSGSSPNRTARSRAASPRAFPARSRSRTCGHCKAISPRRFPSHPLWSSC